MRYWYDTEFYEHDRTIDLISFGIVAEDGREFYCENSDFDWNTVPADHWIQKNVRPWLWGQGSDILRSHEETSEAVRDFIKMDEAETNNELWGYYADYDHVVLAWLFGRMVDMPKGIPWYTMDLKQWQVQLGVKQLPAQVGVEHHALSDARQNKRVWDFLAAEQFSQNTNKVLYPVYNSKRYSYDEGCVS